MGGVKAVADSHEAYRPTSAVVLKRPCFFASAYDALAPRREERTGRGTVSENSNIEWTHHTSTAGGLQGSARRMATATPANGIVDGADRTGARTHGRMILGEWSKPAKWDRAARDALAKCIACSALSMCDIFEAYPEDRPVVDQQGNWVQARGEMADTGTEPAVLATTGPCPPPRSHLRHHHRDAEPALVAAHEAA